MALNARHPVQERLLNQVPHVMFYPSLSNTTLSDINQLLKIH